MKKVLCTLVLLTVMSVSAWADDFANSPKTYVLVDVAIAPVASYDGESPDKTVWGLGAIFGYFLTENIAAELGARINFYDSVPYATNSNYNWQLTGTDIKIGAIYAHPIEAFKPYAGVGVMYSRTSIELAHKSVALSSSASSATSDSGFGVYGKAGVKYEFGFQNRYIVDLGAEYASRFMDKSLSTLSVQLGVGYKF